MITKATSTDGQWKYFVSNSELQRIDVEGYIVGSGKVLADSSDIDKFVSADSIKGIPEREFVFQQTKQVGQLGDKTWIKVPHADVVDMLPVMGDIHSPDTKINTTTVYLSGDDIAAFVGALETLGFKCEIETPIKSSTREEVTVLNSRINQFMPFEKNRLVRSFYEGREFVNISDESSVARIENIIRKGNRKTQFVVTVEQQERRASMALENFSERYEPVDMMNGTNVPIDMQRYMFLGEHKLTPLADDHSYINYKGNDKASDKSMDYAPSN